MKTLRSLIGSVSVLFFALHSALAWNESGHLQIAAFAYGELSDADRAACDNILKSHVKYNTWKTEHDTYRGRTPDNREVSLGFYVFTRAAVWPDEIRDYNKPETHATWHFITYPLKPTSYFFRPELTTTDNVVTGIGHCMDLLEDSHTDAVTKAKYLSFLIHLVGDIHQPLHCGSLFNSRFTQSDGDKGGNRFYVKEPNSNTVKKLHSHWDGLLGSGDDPDNVKDNAAAIKTAFPKGNFTTALAQMNIVEWAKASRKNAINESYRKFSKLTPTKANPTTLPVGYTDAAKVKAREYAALAGYRLAEAINQVVD